jgi:subtilisin family serine protease
MLRGRVLGVLGGLLLAACSDRASSPPEPTNDADARVRPLAPAPPEREPELPTTGERDANGDRLDDVFDEQLRSAGNDQQLLQARVKLQVALNAPVEQADLDEFVADGGQVDYVFGELRYGWIGRAPLERLKNIGARLGARLHLVLAPSTVIPFMDEATRSGRIRGLWAPGFAGSASGYSGNSNITVAVLDTGVDDSHTDLNGRMVSWTDYSSDPAGPARDVEGHGTHVASIAVGTGAAFGAGTATLSFTQSGTLSGVAPNNYLQATVHTPAYLGGASTLTASASAKFLGGASTTLFTTWAPDPNTAITQFGSKTGASPLTLTNQNGGTSGMIYLGALVQSTPPAVTNFAVASSIADYPGVADGFNALRGVAPSCKFLSAKVFPDVGTGSSFDIEEALDDVAKHRLTNGVKVMNLSLGISGGGVDTDLRAFANSAVNAGIVVVVAAGNDGPTTKIGDPGRASKVITVGATNDLNELTTYTSLGLAGSGVDDDAKPDVLAPGGSAFRSAIMAADSNTDDGQLSGFADLVPNDYAPMQGTSMATPFVSGSIALMIDALQQSGTAWTFSSSAQPLFLKMLLSASATELNVAREQGAANSPSLGRATTPKDLSEGYGIINPDAAIEAMLQTFVSPLTGSVSNVAPARLEWERRAWGRKLSLVNGATLILNLDVPSGADYDLYLYADSDDGKGNPVLRASSTKAGNGTDESISYLSSATETAYMFVKRVSGFGSFSCTGSAVSHCGDGHLDTGELCDPAIAGSTACCTDTCSIVTNGTSCDDGNACTKADSCQAGSCTGENTVICAALDQCHAVGSCDTSTGICSNPKQTDGTSCDDKSKCTQTDTCLAGVCTGANPVVCTASDQCHDVGACDATTGVCTDPKKSDGASCSDGNKCTQSDTCVAGLCTGKKPLTCPTPDQCHEQGTCEAATGACSNPAKGDGSPCSDGNFCTQADTCVAGSCAAGAAVVCTALDQCHPAGVCDPGSGACSSPVASDGTACDDNDGCPVGDACQSGVCTSTGSATCGEPNDGTGGQPGAGGEANEAGAAGVAGAGGRAGTDAGGTPGAASGGSSGAAGSGTSGATGGGTSGAAGGGDAAVVATSGSDPDPGSSAGETAIEPTAGSAPIVATDSTAHKASGCGCTLPGHPAPNRLALILLAGAALTLHRRRSTRSSALATANCELPTANCQL